MSPRKVYCATLGCDKNLVDSEALLGRFAAQGVQAVPDLDEADIWVLNTCGFIDAARSDSEETLQALIDFKTDQTLVVCGCWSQESADSIRRRFPAVDVVAGVGQFDKVVAACLGQEEPAGAAPAAHVFPLAGAPIVSPPMEAQYTGLVDRPLLTPPHLAFVKIGEGCNCACTFCRIPLIRGKLVSRPTAEILQEVRNLAGRGVSEIQIVSQNTSDYGRDTGENLLDLITTLNGVEGLRNIRLLYLYSGLVSTDDLLRLLDLEKVAPYLELPIQHASPRILKAMKRPGGRKSSPEFFRTLRRHHPDLVLRSTALLGFPGEEDEDVALLADFLAEVEFDHLGTYRYSPESGTPAAEMGDQVPDEVVFDREALIMDLQSEISLGRQESRLGGEFAVVVDRVVPALNEEGSRDEDDGTRQILEDLARRPGGDPARALLASGGPVAVGRSHHYGYDLDGVVLLPGTGLRAGQYVTARFGAATAYDTWAVPCGESRQEESSP
ncbi:hypothetical protein CSA17_01275 [bacterium DOLJORAL78_65_58]|nr:MAG: hypothetical protein CSB20_00845 [bacterium DOLZORAL124_64_63]PIE76620.1 MAG: hypothetical protein CSA17_01275 [bacterium DOLJORAL78_65_58]